MKCLEIMNALKRFMPMYCSLRCSNRFSNVQLPEIDLEYLCQRSNHDEIKSNLKSRGMSNNLKVFELASLIEEYKQKDDKTIYAEKIRCLEDELKKEAINLPNTTHPNVSKNASREPVILEELGTKRTFEFKAKDFNKLALDLNLIRIEKLGLITGDRSYYLKKELASLEQALIRYSLEKLLRNGFTLVSVPDLLSPTIIEGCGMKTKGKRSQVYHLDGKWDEEVCLSGTAEMSLAALHTGKLMKSEGLPHRLCAVSRCFRAETSRIKKERGIYRVHQFTKVEMFGLTANSTGNESELLLEEFVNIQKTLFSDLGLHCKVIEMPPCDLGSPAYHKIDIEAWMPGREIFGEISSASNCTDYQSRRLQIKYKTNSPDSNLQSTYCHTINGTACAIPRMLIAIFENFQNKDGSINVPELLQKYMNVQVIKEKFKEKMQWMPYSLLS